MIAATVNAARFCTGCLRVVGGEASSLRRGPRERGDGAGMGVDVVAGSVTSPAEAGGVWLMPVIIRQMPLFRNYVHIIALQ